MTKNSQLNINNDLRNNYLSNVLPANLDKIDVCLIIGLNIRLEAPLLNLRLRKNVLSNKLKIYILGPNSDLTYPVIYLGNNTKYLIQIVEGRHPICKVLSKASNPQIFIGTSTLETTSNIFNLLAKWVNPININTINQFPTNIIDLEYNLANNRKLNKCRKQLLYILNHDDVIINKNKTDFIIYQGHHGSHINLNVDLILPGSTLLEKNGTLINIYGLHQNINFCAKPPVLARNDWKILEALMNFIGFKTSYFNLKTITHHLNNISPARDIQHNLNLSMINKFKIKNSYITSNMHNFYLTDILARNSNTLALASSRFNLHNNNFINK